ncbi:hypothetical protein M758_3G130000 [Ceratodon purpureus]|nr:hypothetical protein M758_3G130000 [Ceratodon purpureus]
MNLHSLLTHRLRQWPFNHEKPRQWGWPTLSSCALMTMILSAQAKFDNTTHFCSKPSYRLATCTRILHRLCELRRNPAASLLERQTECTTTYIWKFGLIAVFRRNLYSNALWSPMAELGYVVTLNYVPALTVGSFLQEIEVLMKQPRQIRWFDYSTS